MVFPRRVLKAKHVSYKISVPVCLFLEQNSKASEQQLATELLTSFFSFSTWFSLAINR